METIDNQPVTESLLKIGGLAIPYDCRRIFITAELEPSNGDPRIQPTGFPDVGPVLYPDPAEKNGLICLIESEASMANRLEEVCFSNKHEGTLKESFAGLPYLRAEDQKGTLKTTSTMDGHRFASDFLAKGKAEQFGKKQNGKKQEFKTLAEYIKEKLGMDPSGKTMPIANVPNVFPLVLELDTMSLVHGFQVSNKQISFVGLRLPRVLTASIIGFGCERISVPGIKFNVGQVESESGQAIFQKPRITAKKIEARFSIDVGLLSSLRLVQPPIDNQQADPEEKQKHATRLELLLATSLWKVAAFLNLLSIELSLRTECKVRIKSGTKLKVKLEGDSKSYEQDFPYNSIAKEDLRDRIIAAKIPNDRSPLILKAD